MEYEPLEKVRQDPNATWAISAKTHQMAVDYDLWEGV